MSGFNRQHLHLEARWPARRTTKFPGPYIRPEHLFTIDAIARN